MENLVKAYGTEQIGKPLHEMNIKRRALGKNDVEFEVLYCGICHSDLHQLHNDFNHTILPIVPGHEIVGRVTKIGEEVSKFQVGELVAVGCIVDSCGHCEFCEHDIEQFCEEGVTFSFNSPDKISGGHTFGGFSKTYVCKEHYAIKMPNFEDLAASAPLLCAGITVYSPLKRWDIKKGSKVAILGIGGLGHVAIKMAKALGAEVSVLTHSANKLEDAKRLGADETILTSDENQVAKCARKFDFILDTVSAKHDIDMYLNMLTWEGSLVLVGLPPENLEVNAFSVVGGCRNFSGSNIGGIAQTEEMLQFCYDNDIVCDIEKINIQDVNEAFTRLENNDVKYRFVIDMSSLK